MRPFTKTFGKIRGRGEARAAEGQATRGTRAAIVQPVDIAPNDPVLAYFQANGGAVDLDALALESPGLEALRASGIKLVVPLINQGELIGLLNLGPRLSEQEYSADDRHLLENLAGQVAPAVMVAQLVRQQEAEARTRERFEQELRVAQLIQQNFLPKEPPTLDGWTMTAYYQPAREVGGDFYDFIRLDDGRIGVVAGDVTDKGVPAALVMAATRSVIRAAALRLSSPGEVLERVNDVVCPDMPPNMFATCLYGILDPTTGCLVFANAGHNLPYLYTAGGGMKELVATGMPVGLLPGMKYEESEVVLEPGDSVLLHSDGLAEAHNRKGEMFGFPRLREIVAVHGGDTDLIGVLRRELAAFSGIEGQQEDDVTLVTLARIPMAACARPKRAVLEAFEIESAPGNERVVTERVMRVVAAAGVSAGRLERVGTAVGEATMNAMEHGNRYQADLPVRVSVEREGGEIVVAITDRGSHGPPPEPAVPDLDAKLAGLQPPRGWGLFLIRNMVDDLRTWNSEGRHTVELVFTVDGESDD
jgi:serine phosphatase RsbU (regulator of sigma subunit)/anti-sigma regulatory factor (Ser/Thr protein kinase)